jgi:hypothetical protein
VSRFPLRLSAWGMPVIHLLCWRRPVAIVEPGWIRVRVGLHGGADIPAGAIARVGTMRWPWWAGIGVRIARGMVAFVTGSGTLVVLELSEPIRVRAPLSWSTARIGIGVEDAEDFMAAVAEARSSL